MNTPETIDRPNGKLHDLAETAGKFAAAAVDVDVLKKKVEYAVEDAFMEAERMAKHGKYAVEDMIDDTTHLIKKNPWRAVGYSLGAGLGVGMIAGWFLHRPPKVMEKEEL